MNWRQITYLGNMFGFGITAFYFMYNYPSNPPLIYTTLTLLFLIIGMFSLIKFLNTFSDKKQEKLTKMQMGILFDEFDDIMYKNKTKDK